MEHRASSEIAKKSFVRSPAVAEESLRNGFQTLRRGDRVSYAGAIKWSTPSCSPTPNLQTSTPSCSPTPTCDGAATALVPRPVRHDDASLRPTGHEPPTDQRRAPAHPRTQRQRTGQRTGRSVRRPRMRTPQRRRALGSLIGARAGTRLSSRARPCSAPSELVCPSSARCQPMVWMGAWSTALFVAKKRHAPSEHAQARLLAAIPEAWAQARAPHGEDAAHRGQSRSWSHPATVEVGSSRMGWCDHNPRRWRRKRDVAS
jgi:hypothetical protein